MTAHAAHDAPVPGTAGNRSLKRNLGPVLLVLFGLGNILGAGIYVLVGKVAGEAGYLAPFSFLVAAVVALFSALSYSELAVRYPEAGGEVAYLEEAFHVRALSFAVGLLIAVAAILSAATIARGFAGYVQVFWSAPTAVILVAALVLLAAAAIWGVKASLLLAGMFTLLEVSGLLIIIVPAVADPGPWMNVVSRWPTNPEPAMLGAILAGAFLAFYAFIGFEDMVNMAEEARNPGRDMPMAILAALILSTLFYALTVWVALGYMSPSELNASGAPLTDLYQRVTGDDPVVLTLVALFAVINGALVQIIMVSRLLYGMGRRFPVLRFFFRVNAATRTPVRATLVATTLILLLALGLPVRALAEYTSGLVLLVFVLVNVSLLAIKRRRTEAEPAYSVPVWVPVAGVVTTAALLCYIAWTQIMD